MTSKIHGSQSAFDNGLVRSSSRTGCYRNQLITANGINEPFPKELAELGALNEANHENLLKEQGIKYEREVVTRAPVPHTDAMFSGRVDFLLTLEDGTQVIHELKSASSKNTYQKVFTRGEYKTENLAQLVAYMFHRQVQCGRLIYSFYENNLDKWCHVEDQMFNVTFREDGCILVNGNPSPWTLQMYLTHARRSGNFVAGEEIPPRPGGHNAWDGPCKYCPFAPACAMADDQQFSCVSAFLDECRSIINRSNEEQGS